MLAIYSGVAFTVSGSAPVVAANATVEVRREDTNGLADIYSDEAGTTPITNPSAFADANGRFAFYALGLERGYKITVTKDASSYTLRNQAVGKAAQVDVVRKATSSRSSDTILTTLDIGSAIIATGTFTQTFDPVASLGAGWWAFYRNDGSGTITLDPSGGQLIDGQATVDLQSAQACLLVCDGTSLKTFSRLSLPTSAVITTRQTARLGAVDANGYANFISAGAGLNFNVDASPTPLVLDFAAGSVDLTSTLTADASNQGSLVASNTNFLHATNVDSATVTWGSTLVPPQYGYAFDRTQGALLNFEGADTSTTMLDDFGNTWTAAGNAQIDTAQFKFGTASLLLDGTGDYIESTNFKSLGEGSWEISCWFRLNATSGVHTIAALDNAGGYGAVLAVDHNAGSRRIALRISSDATSNNIANGNLGTTALSLATWYKARMVFDALAGTYRIYLSANGAAEVQEVSISSTARVSALTRARLGNGGAGLVEFNGWIDAFRFLPCATNTTTETPSASAPTITDHPVHWFSNPEMKMYEVTSASGSAGTNPGMTARNRVFVAEADTSGAAVTAVRNYALRGAYVSPLFDWAASNSAFTKSHNIGVRPLEYQMFMVNMTTDANWRVGREIIHTNFFYDGAANRGATLGVDRNVLYFNTVSSGWRIADGAGDTPITNARWQVKLVARRGF